MGAPLLAELHAQPFAPETATLALAPVASMKAPRGATHAAKDLPAPRKPLLLNKVLVPVRYSAWLQGDIGLSLERTMVGCLDLNGPFRITRLPRHFLIESDEASGPFLEAVHRATLELEAKVAAAYPVIHHQMGPVWTGTLQSVFA